MWPTASRFSASEIEVLSPAFLCTFFRTMREYFLQITMFLPMELSSHGSLAFSKGVSAVVSKWLYSIVFYVLLPFAPTVRCTESLIVSIGDCTCSSFHGHLNPVMCMGLLVDFCDPTRRLEVLNSSAHFTSFGKCYTSSRLHFPMRDLHLPYSWYWTLLMSA